MALDQPSADQSRKNCDLQFFFVIGGDSNKHSRCKCFWVPLPVSPVECFHVFWNSAGLKIVPSAIPIHSYLYWIDIELMNKWHWTSPRQIKVEKTVIYSFSLFENAGLEVSTLVFLSVSMCVCCVVFLCVSVCLLSMCEATVCLLSLWVRGLSQGQFTKLVGPRDRGCLQFAQ